MSLTGPGANPTRSTPKDLYTYLRSYPQVDRICLFAGEDDHPKSREFLDECRKIGYEVISKPVKYVPTLVEKSPFWESLKEHVPEKKLRKLRNQPVLRRKADFDVELAKELLLHIDEYHTFVLFSGDGDYATVIEEIMKREKRVFIVSTERALGKEFREMMDQKVHPLFVDVNKLKDVVRFRSSRGNRRGGSKPQKGLFSRLLSGILGGK